MNFIIGSYIELGKLDIDARKAILEQIGKISYIVSENIIVSQGKGANGDPMRPNTKAISSGRADRSSEEASVMDVEQRV